MSEITVTSELYSEKNYKSTCKPIYNKNNIVSQFNFNLPAISAKFDKDNDLIVERKNQTMASCIEIEHSDRTELELVGLQIWRGALLMSDFLLYNNQEICNKKILELGTGTGLSGIVAGMFSPVICTDINKGGILDLIKNNVQRNQKILKYPIEVLELDFLKPFSPEINKNLPEIQIIIAADVIYDNNITDAFVNTLFKILSVPPSRKVFISLEKRFVFMTEDLKTNAPMFDYFLECLNKLKSIKKVKIEELMINFPKYFDYERVKELVLIKISSNY